MTLEEYKNKIAAERERHNREMERIERECAISNSAAKVGDVITCLSYSIKVERVLYYPYNTIRNIPYCTYIGTQVLKNGQPTRARKSHTRIHEYQITSINGKRYEKGNYWY